jgi:hypothetical protein
VLQKLYYCVALVERAKVIGVDARPAMLRWLQYVVRLKPRKLSKELVEVPQRSSDLGLKIQYGQGWHRTRYRHRVLGRCAPRPHGGWDADAFKAPFRHLRAAKLQLVAVPLIVEDWVECELWLVRYIRPAAVECCDVVD